MNIYKLFGVVVLGFVLSTGCQKDENEAGPVSSVSRLYVSNADLDAAVVNTMVFDRADGEALDEPYKFDSKLPDGNGIYFDVSAGIVYQVSRRAKNIKTFTVKTDGTLADRSSFIDESVPSAREIALDKNNNLLYVSSNTDSAIYVYEKPGSLTGSVTANKKLKLSGQPWGIHLENNRLLVVMDQEMREVQIFDNASSLVVGVIKPTKTLMIAGAGRLHGITFSAGRDVLLLTDIGLASGAGSESDGAIHIIEAAEAKIAAGGTITPTRTIRGSSTFLGNPVDIAWDPREEKELIYIAEKIGTRILVFKYSDTGNSVPSINKILDASPEALFLDVR